MPFEAGQGARRQPWPREPQGRRLARTEVEKRILRLWKQNAGIAKIAQTLGAGTGLVPASPRKMPAYIAVVNANQERADNRHVGPNASPFLRCQKRRAPT